MKTRVNYLHLVIQSVVDNNSIVTKPTKWGLPLRYITNEMPEDVSDKESEVDSVNENTIIFDLLFTPKLKNTESIQHQISV